MKGLIFLTALLLLTPLCQAADYKTILLVSVDALHPDAVSKENSPNIMYLAENGAYSPFATSSNPPKTLISHTVMLTGLQPLENGKTDNAWQVGEPRVSKPTLLSAAKGRGYETCLIYSKQKLGYLKNSSTDTEIFAKDDAVEKTAEVLDTSKKQFIFLHISGLDTEGPVSGWMSEEYVDEFRFIDEQLGALFKKALKSPSVLIIVTSDHAGHDKIHGSDHPEDFKRPLAVFSSLKKITHIPDSALKIDGLKKYIEEEF
ncbi:alkaline phosphatase family protein [Seleniivibrio woodruffii]|uniref:Phosphopentomutase/2, 3-bisphosphoglycerate-independent phosphoglycerate mutase family metalloenzyme n=1 Tax=Seleniivibrio woodruffii TaxID=1078050 RepID=A0A4V6NEF7_9BACT|nr:alkaline phosphatase family protein [Seleniivibrio woodruffii]TCK60491.1 phosphopentomutase/2,3-bisphosphoglycerate-independent phosphoglycerate mutase family metalloenzyme [Seleniivibrio woodruffii]TVZ36119.1 phosphopentomutase/2,3-bisphosphoglycerate-independent phosphoglycerate mutase family metalloenzyme [Seleniivibrio woodruffii]